MLDSVFTYTDADHSLTIDAEVLLIEAAQAGDPDAYADLLLAYGPTLRATVSKAKKTLDAEEAQATALLAFAEVLASHDPRDENYADGRLASRLTPHLKDSLGIALASENAAFTVPKRTYTRFLGILNEADGDHEAARALAPSRSMTVETFDAVSAAVAMDSLDTTTTDDEGFDRASHSDAAPLYGPAPVCDVEDRMLVEAAFRAVDDEEERICRLAYGFTEYEPLSDGEISERMDLFRSTVQRKRGKALGKMRKALGVAPVA